MSTYFERYCEENKFDIHGVFELTKNEDGLMAGTTVKLYNDDDSSCPSFEIVNPIIADSDYNHLQPGKTLYLYASSLTQTEVYPLEGEWDIKVADKLREEVEAKVKEYNAYLAARPKDTHAKIVLGK